MSIPKDSHIYDIIIIGAGPIGLAVANGLYQRGINNLLVLDKTREFRKVGTGFSLLPNGLKSLKYLNLSAYEAVTKTAITTSQNWNQRDLNGNLLRSMSQEFDDWLEKYGEGRISIGWYDFQTSLRKCLPADKILINRYCKNIREEANNGCLKIETESNFKAKKNPYANWQENSLEQTRTDRNIEKQSFFAKLVVGADGINSIVRQALFKILKFDSIASTPEYSGFAGIFGKKSYELDRDNSKKIQELYLQNASLVTIRKNINVIADEPIEEPRIILFQPNNNKFDFIVQGALPKELILNKEGTDSIDIFKNTLISAGFPDCLIAVLNKANPEQNRKLLYYIHPAIISSNFTLASRTNNLLNDRSTTEIYPPWFGKRIVLVGDAAHGMPPFSGQGTNQGLEDAAVLTKLITEIKQQLNCETTIETALEKYDRIRRPLLIKLQKLTLGPFSYWNKSQIAEYNQSMYSRSIDTILAG